MEYSDRYGGNWPDPETVCKGKCEGMGFYPFYPQYPVDISYDPPFVVCEDCGGTGKQK